MRRIFIALAVGLPLICWAGGPVKIQRGVGGGTVKLQRGSGGGPVKISVGLSEPTDLAFTASSSNTLSLSWTASILTPAATNYSVQISTNGNFASAILSSDTAGTTASFSGLLVNRVYAARVRATTNGFSPSTWSGVRSTGTLAVTPATAASTWTYVGSSSITFAWTAGDNPASITQYQAHLSTVNGFGSGSTLSSTTYNLNATFTGLSDNTVYYGRVRAINPSGIPTNFLDVGSTTTVALPTIVFQASATAQSSSAGLTLTWNHTVSAGSNLAMVVSVCYSVDTTNITTLTYNLDALTLGDRTQQTGPSPDGWCETWWMVNPDVGTNAVLVTFAGNVTNKAGGSFSVTGAKQTGQPDVTDGDSNTSASPSVPVTVVADRSWCFDALGVFNADTAQTATSPQTERFEQRIVAADDTTFAGSTKPTLAPGVTNMAWSINNEQWALSVTCLSPAPVP